MTSDKTVAKLSRRGVGLVRRKDGQLRSGPRSEVSVR
jgi:hypothetical protein